MRETIMPNDIILHKPTEVIKALKQEGMVNFIADHAKAIKDFVARFSDIDDLTVIVHCDAGVSRSAGVAAALSEYYNGDDSYFFDSGIYMPNMLCYRTILNELYG